MNLLWLVPALPLAGFVINGALGGRLPHRAVGIIGCGTVGAAFLIAIGVLRNLLAMAPEARRASIPLFEWIASGDLRVAATLLADPLSVLMVLVVSGVGFVIHVYSTGYMAEDDGYSRYFSYLNLFVFSMLLLVLAGNLLVMFVGWEMVGLCSYLLIGFWFEKPSAAAAGRKAFVVNRIGDAGFMLGMILLFVAVGTLDFQAIAVNAPAKLAAGGAVVTAITLLLFMGATGKSAQLPLYLWLPDAMEGPTPVSALIHAATMVTAGVYMIARLNPLFALAPVTLEVVAVVGALTAIFAASVAMVENDLKRILAYSTISQLGYMFLAAGIGAFGAAMFHLTSHAFFKALLFLAAGSVMHAMHGEIDIRRLGGLRPHLPVTALTFVIGGLALAGVPPLVGFFSKDLILVTALEERHYVLWLMGTGAALLTAIYTARAAGRTFFGTPGPAVKEAHHLHEAPGSMAVPLWVLAALSVAGGVLGATWTGEPLQHFLRPVVGAKPAHAPLAEGLAVAVAVLGLLLGWAGYVTGRLRVGAPALAETVARRFYIEAAYDLLVVRPLKFGARVSAAAIDPLVIDGAVNGVGRLVQVAGTGLRHLQTGYVRAYAAVLLAGTVIALGYWLIR